MANKYLMIDTKMLPDVFEKVVEVKKILKTNQAKDISEAVKCVGISRSTYYKYKDYVFTVSNTMKEHKVTVAMLLGHEMGTLSRILDKIAENKGNVLTINQDIPINETANVTITFDILNLDVELNVLIEEIKNMRNVIKVNLIAME